MHQKPKFAFFTLATLAVSASGCASQVAPLASHTVQVAPDQEADVLWMLKDGRLVRCSGYGGRPSCTAVDVP